MSEKTKEKQAEKTGVILQAKPIQTLSRYEEFDRLFDDFISRNWLSPFRFDWPTKDIFRTSLETKLPKVDVIDRDSEIVIRCEVPGVDKKDLEITMTERTVAIKGEARHEQKEEKGNYFRHEISRGSFSRTVSLPCDVDSEKTKSTFKDGLLELIAPKTKAVKRHTVKL